MYRFLHLLLYYNIVFRRMKTDVIKVNEVLVLKWKKSCLYTSMNFFSESNAIHNMSQENKTPHTKNSDYHNKSSVAYNR